jgi:hypothetical protein
MPKADLEQSFPGLLNSGYCITSPATPLYNCAAWAAGENHRWWEPVVFGGYFWPPDVPMQESLSALVAAFGTLNYGLCSDSSLQPGIEKLAIYADAHSWPTHVARQLASGTWTSKLGASEDIEHDRLEALEGAIYGKVTQCLSRPLRVTAR